jgi:hypothetical protein
MAVSQYEKPWDVSIAKAASRRESVISCTAKRVHQVKTVMLFIRHGHPDCRRQVRPGASAKGR